MENKNSKTISTRDKLLVQLVDWTKPLYTKWFKKNTPAWNYNKMTLLQFPEKTLGRTLGEFLKKEQLELMPKMEDHDVFHVLLDFKTTIKDEVRMQFFLLGNGKRSMYAIVTAFIGILIQPEHIVAFRKAFYTGKQCLPISKWAFQHLLHEPIALLQNQIFKRNMPEEAPLFI